MSAEQIVNQPFLYVNNFPIAVASNTTITVGAGQCRDSTNTFDMTLSSTVTINAATNGLNGLDTGTLQPSTLYAIYVVTDPVNGEPAGALLSTSLTAPVMPFNYSAFRLIGYAAADVSSHLIPAFIAGNNNYRKLIYQNPQSTGVDGDSDTAYINITLGSLVPAINNIPVDIQGILTPGAAGRILYIKSASATGDQVQIYGQVTSVVVAQINTVMATLVSGLPKIAFKVSNAGDSAVLNVYGFEYFI